MSLDTTVPNTKEEFEQYGSVLTQKLNQLAKHAEFPPFGEELIKSVALNRKYIILKGLCTYSNNILKVFPKKFLKNFITIV